MQVRFGGLCFNLPFVKLISCLPYSLPGTESVDVLRKEVVHGTPGDVR